MNTLRQELRIRASKIVGISPPTRLQSTAAGDGATGPQETTGLPSSNALSIPMTIAFRYTFAALFFVLTSMVCVRADGVLEVIAEAGDPSPVAGEKYSTFVRRGNSQAPDFIHDYYTPVINDNGEVAFWATLGDTLGEYAADTATFIGTPTATRLVARTGDELADDANILGQMQPPQIDPHGGVWFSTSIRPADLHESFEQGLIYGTATGNQLVAETPLPTPSGEGDIYGFAQVVANPQGAVAFVAPLQNTFAGSGPDRGLFLYEAGSLEEIVRYGGATPDGLETFTTLGQPGINSAGDVALYAGTTAGVGLYLSQGGVLQELAREGKPAIPGQFSVDVLGSYPQYEVPALNDSGHVAFRSFDDAGQHIHVAADGVVTRLIGTGFPALDGNGIGGTFHLLGFNNQGQTALKVEFGSTSGPAHPHGGKVDAVALYRVSDSEAVQIARAADLAPDGEKYYDRFDDVTINEQGLMVYHASLTNAPGQFTLDAGVFLSDGIETVEAVRYGDPIGDRHIFTLGIGGTGFFDDTFGETLHPAHRPLNLHGQIAFHSQTGGKNEVIALYTPTLHWRSGNTGSWDNRMNWTLSLQPHEMHRVVVDPASPIEIQGPSNTAKVRTLHLGTPESAAATLRLDGALADLRVAEEFVVAPVGTLLLSNDATLSSPLVTNHGTINGSGSISGFVVNESGTVSPNAETPLQIAGDFQQDAEGTLEIEIGGTAEEEYDQLAIIANSNVFLDGTLEVRLLDLGDELFTPALGDSFSIVRASAVTGSFTNLVLPTLTGDLTWLVDYRPSEVLLHIFDPSSADLNGDGVVDGLDLGILLGNYDQNATPSGGELNGTDPVDGLDLGILLGAWNPPAAIASVVSVPEPSSSLLAWLALLWSIGSPKFSRRPAWQVAISGSNSGNASYL